MLVVCRHVDRKDMFTDLYPTFEARKDVTDLIGVEEARVPVIKFSMDGPCHTLPFPDCVADRAAFVFDMRSSLSCSQKIPTTVPASFVLFFSTLEPYAESSKSLCAIRRTAPATLLSLKSLFISRFLKSTPAQICQLMRRERNTLTIL